MRLSFLFTSQFSAALHELTVFLGAKVQGHWPVGSEDRVESNGQTEAIALPPMLMQSRIINFHAMH